MFLNGELRDGKAKAKDLKMIRQYVLENAVELVAASYSRRAINFLITTSNETSNVASVKFPEAREDWGKIIGIGIYDSITGGNLINYALFDARDEVIIHALMQYEIAKNFYVIGLRN